MNLINEHNLKTEPIGATCCICLTNGPKTCEITTQEPPIKTKLQSIIPEIEWLEDYHICPHCAAHVDTLHAFRSATIALEARRKSLLAPMIFTCYHCNGDFTSKPELAHHIKDKHKTPAPPKTPKLSKKRKFRCDICAEEFAFMKTIVEHCVSLHSMERSKIKFYTCDQCPMRFASSANLIQHKKYHGGARSHICSFCGKTFITKSDLTFHEYTHFNRRNYKCLTCSKAFNTNKNLRTHQLVVHTDPLLWKYHCELCPGLKRFPLKSGYEQHVRRHNGDKRFTCVVCSKPFVSRSEVQRHMGFHSQKEPFKCELCPKGFKEKRLFEGHLARVHQKGKVEVVRERKFVCHICPSAFFDRSKLERHLWGHEGVKPFGCEKCDKRFSDKYYVKQHVKKVHS